MIFITAHEVYRACGSTLVPNMFSVETEPSRTTFRQILGDALFALSRANIWNVSYPSQERRVSLSLPPSPSLSLAMRKRSSAVNSLVNGTPHNIGRSVATEINNHPELPGVQKYGAFPRRPRKSQCRTTGKSRASFTRAARRKRDA